MVSAVFLILTYLMGSLPSGVLLARALSRPDPRTTSLEPSADRKFHALSIAADFAKGAIPVLALMLSWPQDHFFAEIAALLAVAGHCYSIFLLMKGGKGVATMAGALFPLAPIAMLVALTAWALIFYVFRIASLASVLALFVLMVALFALRAEPLLIIVSALCGWMVVRHHRPNLECLLQGREPITPI